MQESFEKCILSIRMPILQCLLIPEWQLNSIVQWISLIILLTSKLVQWNLFQRMMYPSRIILNHMTPYQQGFITICAHIKQCETEFRIGIGTEDGAQTRLKQYQVADTLKHRDVSEKTITKFCSMYAKGHSPATALNTHKLDMHLQYNKDYVYGAADRAKCLDTPVTATLDKMTEDGPASPYIASQGNPLNLTADYFIILENECIIRTNKLTDALILTFMLFYVFCLEYPKRKIFGRPPKKFIYGLLNKSQPTFC
ncbi:hypothetical protein GQR58_014326 [Nymphon striatum]|nr:hypothetical protein GQR58_014326 [Nymphon striatum]